MIRSITIYVLALITNFSIISANPASLNQAEATLTIQSVYDARKASIIEERRAELSARSLTVDGFELKWLQRTFGTEPADGRALYISMHGGGATSAATNDAQWQNQINLYQPNEGIYVAPRAPTNTWNMWFQDHIDPLFSRLIENMIVVRGVNPNKVYLMGYSAGGDGVWQLAPRTADRYAAASMMAGHPNTSSLLSLRNLPFGMFVGANDTGSNRNQAVAAKIQEMQTLQQADPQGYTHIGRVYPNLGHWMNLQDAEAVPWMASFTRNPWPKKVVWRQGHVPRNKFYWLEVPEDYPQLNQQMKANVTGQNITLTGDVPEGTKLLLSDQLINLDQPINVTINGGKIVTYNPQRLISTIENALQKRMDIPSTPTAEITLTLPKNYDAWIQSHLLPSERDNPSKTDQSADPDKDGISNLVEYALGSDPSAHNLISHLHKINQTSPNEFTFNFNHSTAGLNTKIESSTDLKTWKPLYQSTNNNPFTQISPGYTITDQGSPRTISIKPNTPTNNLFYRLKVTN